MDLSRIKRKLIASYDLFTGQSRYTYAQYGEDILIDVFFSLIKIEKPTYLDIGTNHPKSGSNTYLLYTKGSKGVCIEPDYNLYQLICKKRPLDKVINAGIGFGTSQEATFYYFEEPYTVLSTFSLEDALFRQKETGANFKEKKGIPFLNVNDIIKENFHPCPNIISIDVEGFDYEILNSIDFNQYRPELFCIETLEYNKSGIGVRDTKIFNLLAEKGYAVYADTYLNTLFVRAELLNNT